MQEQLDRVFNNQYLLVGCKLARQRQGTLTGSAETAPKRTSDGIVCIQASDGIVCIPIYQKLEGVSPNKSKKMWVTRICTVGARLLV